MCLILWGLAEGREVGKVREVREVREVWEASSVSMGGRRSFIGGRLSDRTVGVGTDLHRLRPCLNIPSFVLYRDEVTNVFVPRFLPPDRAVYAHTTLLIYNTNVSTSTLLTKS